MNILPLRAPVTVASLKSNVRRPNPAVLLKRHIRQDDLETRLEQACNRESKKDIKTRQHLMEIIFAQATRYGYQRARWRRLWRVQIQEYLTAAIQNIKILLKDVKEPAPALTMQVVKETRGKATKIKPCGLWQLLAQQSSQMAGLCFPHRQNLTYHTAEIIG